MSFGSSENAPPRAGEGAKVVVEGNNVGLVTEGLTKAGNHVPAKCVWRACLVLLRRNDGLLVVSS